MTDPISEIVSKTAGIPEVIKEVYGDLAKPGVAQVGKALAGIIGLGNTILYPIHLLNEKSRIYLERNLQKYREKLETISDEKIVSVPPEIGVPIAEKLAYISNEELSDMYISLLANASNIETASLAHPGFAKLIDNLSPDEAIFLQTLRKIVTIPFIEIRLNTGNNTWNSLEDFVVSESITSGLTFKNNLPAYISNLDSLGIIKIRRDIWITPIEKYYVPLWEAKRVAYGSLEKSLAGTNMTLGYEKARADITPFGKLFISACFTNVENT